MGLTERTQGILYEIIPHERCTGSARGGGEAHLFGRSDRSLKRKVVRIWPDYKLETEKERKQECRAKGPQGNLLWGISRVNHCGLFNFQSNRNNE